MVAVDESMGEAVEFGSSVGMSVGISVGTSVEGSVGGKVAISTACIGVSMGVGVCAGSAENGEHPEMKIASAISVIIRWFFIGSSSFSFKANYSANV